METRDLRRQYVQRAGVVSRDPCGAEPDDWQCDDIGSTHPHAAWHFETTRNNSLCNLVLWASPGAAAPRPIAAAPRSERDRLERRVAALERAILTLQNQLDRQADGLRPSSAVIEPDAFLAWCEVHAAELARHAGKFVAFDPSRGVVATDADDLKLIQRLEELGESADSVSIVHASEYT